ncbi:phage portal protein [Escherichia coli]
MLHIFEPVEDGQTRGANQFYSVMERLKMLDSLQATQLQSDYSEGDVCSDD